MVLPDWFLSAVLGTLRFPDTGALHRHHAAVHGRDVGHRIDPVMLLAPGWSRFASGCRLLSGRRVGASAVHGRGKGWRLCFRCGSRWESPRSCRAGARVLLPEPRPVPGQFGVGARGQSASGGADDRD